MLAVLFNEADAQKYSRAIIGSRCQMSAANFVELCIVIEAQTRNGSRQVDEFFHLAEIAIAPVTIEQAQAARRAFTSFGKGRHPAGLNFGDCFAYALASITGEPLLFKGADFSKTDITTVL